jgi:hypothetical protein
MGATAGYALESAAMQSNLESDIQTTWGRANSVRLKPSADPAEVTALIDDLRGCAKRAKALGLPGEQELLRLVERLEWLTSDSHQPPYTRG